MNVIVLALSIFSLTFGKSKWSLAWSTRLASFSEKPAFRTSAILFPGMKIADTRVKSIFKLEDLRILAKSYGE